MERFELIELEKRGYAIHLDSSPIKLRLTYLNEINISEVEINKKRKYVNIEREKTELEFYSLHDLLNRNQYDAVIDMITVDGLILDSAMIQEAKFEDGAVQYMRLLTQKDYEGKEWDNLPDIRRTIGNGLLIISTQPLE
jgi:hypothetical protein